MADFHCWWRHRPGNRVGLIGCSCCILHCCWRHRAGYRDGLIGCSCCILHCWWRHVPGNRDGGNRDGLVGRKDFNNTLFAEELITPVTLVGSLASLLAADDTRNW